MNDAMFLHSNGLPTATCGTDQQKKLKDIIAWHGVTHTELLHFMHNKNRFSSFRSILYYILLDRKLHVSMFALLIGECHIDMAVSAV